jgi:hypothetical protein
MSFQARADELLDKWGVRAPAPILGETTRDYRVRVMRMIARRLPGDSPLRRAEYARCDDRALNALEPELFKAAKAAVYDTRFMEPGEMRVVVERNPDNGQEIHTFVGKDSFVKNPMYGHREGRRVVGGLFQSDVPRLRAMQQGGMSPSETRYNTFGNSKGHERFY